MKSWKAKSLLLFGTAIWGATFMFTQIGIEYCSPSLYIVIRFCIALILCFIFFGKHIVKISKKTAMQGGLLGIFWGFGFLLQTFGLKYTTITNTAFITNLCVVLTPFVYWMISKEKVKPLAKVSVVIGFAGVYVLANPSIGEVNSGDLLILASTIFWALYISYLHIFTKGTADFALNTQLIAFQFIVGLAIVLGYFFAFELPTVYFTLNTALIVSILFNALMASFLVSFIQISVQKYTTPVNAALIFALEPIFASVFSFIFMNEVLSGRGYIGAALMLLAIFVGDTLGLILEKFKKKNNISNF